MLFLKDNAPSRKSTVAMTQFYELGFHMIPHPPYSPDVALCDFFLFSDLIFWLCGKQFSSNEDVVAAINLYFAVFKKNYFPGRIKKLETRWTIWKHLRGFYFEK